MENKNKTVQHYVETFKSYHNGASSQPFHSQREKALNSFEKLGMPNSKMEAYRFSNITAVSQKGFNLAEKTAVNSVTLSEIEPFLLKNFEGARITLVDGYYAEHLSDFNNWDDKVKFNPLAQLLEQGKQPKALATLADSSQNPFIALNTAYATDGVKLSFPKNYKVESPIHILNITKQSNALSTPRLFVEMESGAQATLIETFHDISSEKAFINPVSEIIVAENANLTHLKMQNAQEHSYLISNNAIKQGSNAHYHATHCDFGSKLARNNTECTLDGSGIETTLYGLYIANNTQHIANHTFIDHAKPHCNSHELYRGILKDKSSAVFNGKIIVRPDAQKTDAKQSNSALLLSDSATVDTMPQLEIYADDVKCTHGATIGQMDETALFYLKSRGIGEEKARALLIFAFADEVINNIENKSFLEFVEALLLEKLEN